MKLWSQEVIRLFQLTLLKILSHTFSRILLISCLLNKAINLYFLLKKSMIKTRRLELQKKFTTLRILSCIVKKRRIQTYFIFFPNIVIFWISIYFLVTNKKTVLSELSNYGNKSNQILKAKRSLKVKGRVITYIHKPNLY